MSNVIRQHYGPGERLDHDKYDGRTLTHDDLSVGARQQIRCVLGHYFYGIHEYFPSPFNYFTILRDPVERVLSLYSYLRAASNVSQWYDWVRKATLREFVEKSPEAENFQTKIISGNKKFADLEAARRNINIFSAVGVIEMFNESMDHFARTFGWRDVSCPVTNATDNRVRQSDVHPSDLRLIKLRNQMDLDLHALAKELLVEKLASSDW